MKCPKCGYLGFETTDRCRNCQYDFSLAPFQPEPDLALQSEERLEAVADFDLPPITKAADALSGHGLDLDRLFGEAEREKAPDKGTLPAASEARPSLAVIDDVAAFAVESPISEVQAPHKGQAPAEEGSDESGSALPFDDTPLMPPPAARPPLAVRRSTPEVVRNRPRIKRPERLDSLSFEPEVPSTAVSESVAGTLASLMETPSLSVRIGAGLIDLIFLIAIDIVVLYLTLRITGLQNTLEDLRVLPPIPFAGFLVILAFGYVASFTVAGGQTIGKMVLSLRVIGEDGRPVDPAGGMLRAAGCMLVPITFGLTYVPVLVTSDHRAFHDRLAGTRVVRE
jgi:uncharacterized RDD family membrane protein YckC